jgi:hypothetical protein
VISGTYGKSTVLERLLERCVERRFSTDQFTER